MFPSAVQKIIEFPSSRISRIEPVAGHAIEDGFRELLVHDRHMTLTLEAHNGMPIEVDVLDESNDDAHYVREVLLRRSADRGVAQYAILDVNLLVLPDEIARDLVRAREPFGRVLSRNATSSRIRRTALFRAEIGDALASLVDVKAGTRTYGRSIEIMTNGIKIGEAFEVIMPGQAKGR